MTTTSQPPTIDLRALIQDRRAKDARPSLRATICFDPDVLDQLAELQAEKDARDERKREGGDPDPRMGRKDTLAAQITQLEEQAAASSVVAVFRVPTRQRQAEINRLAEEGEDVDPIIVSEGFSHFMRNGEAIPESELGADDLAAWLATASRGEVNDIAFRIASRSLGTPDFPQSVKRSLAARK